MEPVRETGGEGAFFGIAFIACIIVVITSLFLGGCYDPRLAAKNQTWYEAERAMEDARVACDHGHHDTPHCRYQLNRMRSALRVIRYKDTWQ